MINKKTIITIGILMVIFLGLLLWPKKETLQKTTETTETKPYKQEVAMPDYLNKPKGINWGEVVLEIPETMVIYKYLDEKISEEEMKKFMELVGLDYGQKKISSSGLILFNDAEGKYGAYVDPINKKFQYVENIYYKSDLQSVDKMETVDIQKKLMELVKELSGGQAGININNIDYKEMVSPDWVSTTEDKADAVEISASLTVDQYSINNFNGSPIKAVYRRDGKLLKIEIGKRWGKTEVVKEQRTVGVDELRKMGPSQFLISTAIGGKDYQLKTEGENISQVNLTGLELGYVYVPEKAELWPFYFASGNSITGNGPVKIVLITPATKDN